MSDPLLTPREVEAEYGFTLTALRNWRYMGEGPDYIKTSPGRGGRIKYRRSAIEAWLDARTVTPGRAA